MLYEHVIYHVFVHSVQCSPLECTNLTETRVFVATVTQYWHRLKLWLIVCNCHYGWIGASDSALMLTLCALQMLVLLLLPYYYFCSYTCLSLSVLLNIYNSWNFTTVLQATATALTFIRVYWKCLHVGNPTAKIEYILSGTRRQKLTFPVGKAICFLLTPPKPLFCSEDA